MNLVAEELAAHLAQIENVESLLVRPPLRATRGGRSPSGPERAVGRFLQLPLELAVKRLNADYYHIADHSYAHLALLFPRDRVGIYCHDIDAFRALLPEAKASRSRVALSRLLLMGLRHARVVFHSTLAVRKELLQHELVPAARLVHAPYGVALEFLRPPVVVEERPRPYLLHVGSCIPRKNIEFLLKILAAARQNDPELELVQVGGTWTEGQRKFIADHQLEPHIEQKRGISRDELARLYAGATVVLVPSLAEGFGLPVIEALACGAPVVASDIAVLHEVGFEGVLFCSLDAVDHWTRTIQDVRAQRARVSRATRESVLARYSWLAHATTVWNGYVRSGASPP